MLNTLPRELDENTLPYLLVAAARDLLNVEGRHEALSAAAEAEALTCQMAVRTTSCLARDMLLWVHELLDEAQTQLVDAISANCSSVEAMTILREAADMIVSALTLEAC